MKLYVIHNVNNPQRDISNPIKEKTKIFYFLMESLKPNRFNWSSLVIKI